MAGIPLLIWKIFSTGCVYSSPLCQVSNNQPCSFIVILLLHRDKRTALKTYFRLNTVVVHKQKWNYLHMYKAVYKCSKSQKYLEHSTLMLMNFICAIGLTTRVRGTNKIHHAFQPWACHTLHVKRCNPLWFAKVNDKVWRQVTAIRFYACQWLFIHLQLDFQHSLPQWPHWLKLNSFSHLEELSKQKSILRTAMYWLFLFTLAPSDQATNNLWCLIGCDGNSWHQFAMNTDICGLRQFL